MSDTKENGGVLRWYTVCVIGVKPGGEKEGGLKSVNGALHIQCPNAQIAAESAKRIMAGQMMKDNCDPANYFFIAVAVFEGQCKVTEEEWQNSNSSGHTPVGDRANIN